MAISNLATHDLLHSEQRILLGLRMAASVEPPASSFLARALYDWFGLATVEPALEAFQRLVEDLKDALGDVFAPVRQRRAL